jgi:hypothetical protein
LCDLAAFVCLLYAYFVPPLGAARMVHINSGRSDKHSIGWAFPDKTELWNTIGAVQAMPLFDEDELHPLSLGKVTLKWDH